VGADNRGAEIETYRGEGYGEVVYIFVLFAQLKRLCKFFSTPFGDLGPRSHWLRLWEPGSPDTTQLCLC